MKRLLQAMLVFGVIGLVAQPPALAAQSDWADSPLVQQLYEKARAEGEVSVWSPNARETQWVPKEFGARFPGIEVKMQADLHYTTRLITEARAGRHSADVVTHSLGGVMPLRARELLAPVAWTDFGIAEGNVVLGGQAATTHNFIYSILYSKDRVTPAELPRTWDDLLDPKWKGKLVASAFLLPRMMGYFAIEWGPERAEKWVRALIDDQEILVVNTLTESYLRTGERLLAIAEPVARAYDFQRNGLDAGFLLMDQVPATQYLIAVLKDAPHPNAARLLAAWYVSPEGRALAERLGNESDLRPGSKSALYKTVSDKKLNVILEDEDSMTQRAEYYKQFSGIIRGTTR